MFMDDLAIARAVHVLAIVLWVGGVSMVTTVLLPAARRAGAEGPALFETIERRFARQARLATVLAGASGFYMVQRLDLWERFRSIQFWWMHAMFSIWLLFTFVLFVAEPLFLDRWYRERAAARPESTIALAQRFHWVMLILSLITIAGAVAGSHGMLFFG